MPLKDIPKFGGAKASPSAPQAPSPTQAAPAPSAPAPTPGRRGFSIGKKPADYSTSGATAIPDAPEDINVKGKYHCYLSKLGVSKAGFLYANIKIHAPGEEVHGAEKYLALAVDTTKSPGAQKATRSKIVEFFTKSGFPETGWPVGNAGGKVPPIVDIFTLPVDIEGGGTVRVPVMLEVVFDLEDNEKDNQKPWQRVVSSKMVTPYHAAPVLKFCAAWVAEMCGWPWAESQYGGADVNKGQLAADFEEFGLFQPDGEYNPIE